jgi:quercetin dioxygenase-like cupin family protein
MSDDRGNIPAEPARRTPGHEQVTERLGREVAHIDLEAESKLLSGEETYHRVGRNAKTLIKRPDFRVVLTAIRGGARVAEHSAAGPLTIQTLHGRVRMHLPGGEVDLGPGHLLTLERNERHDVEAVEDSVFLLTIAWPEDH